MALATCQIHFSPHFFQRICDIQALFHYAEDTEIGIRFMRIAESLINGHPNEHFLSAKLTLFVSSVIVLVEPFQAAPDRMLKACNSALIAGEIDMAMSLSLNSSLVCIYSIPDLLSVKKDIVYFFHRSVSIILLFPSVKYTHMSHNASANCIRLSTDHSPSSMNTCGSAIYALLLLDALSTLEKKSSATRNFFSSRRRPRAVSCYTMSSSARCTLTVIFEITQA